MQLAKNDKRLKEQRQKIFMIYELRFMIYTFSYLFYS
jgi:hypothetical protein